MNWKIQRVLISVSDKTGVVDFARTLARHGCEIISTGGTGRALTEAGVAVTDISIVTGNPEAFGGRMKTISFAIESAILFDRERDRDEAASLGIVPIDMVVCNLYPFGAARDRGAEIDELIEQIDIGGPTMIRAAAKNSRFVAVVCDPNGYGALAEELDANGGSLSSATRERLMRTAFNHTADYDAMIASTLDERWNEPSLRLAFDRSVTLRYGENAHQQATFLRQRGAERSLHDLQVLGGKALSYNNIVDLYGALDAVRDLKRSGCAVIKHTNPCGLCDADDQRTALELAWAGDPVSAFGSVIAFNRPVTLETVTFFDLDQDPSRRKFVEAVVAPGFSDEAVAYLHNNERLRIVVFDPADLPANREIRLLAGAALVQDADRALIEKLEVATERRPEKPLSETSALGRLIEFGVIAVRQIKSNTIVLVARTAEGAHRLLGMGAGQPNRVVATGLAVERAQATLRAEGKDDAQIREALGEAVLVSGAFFPFPDSVERAAEAGVRLFVQPGGSIRDAEVIARADALDAVMVLTGMRHFKH